MQARILVISDYRHYHSTRPEAAIWLSLAALGYQIDIFTYRQCAFAQEFAAAGIRVFPYYPLRKVAHHTITHIRRHITENGITHLFLYNSKALINGLRATRKLPVRCIAYRGCNAHIHWYDPAQYGKYFHPRVWRIICNSSAVTELFQKQLFFKKEKAITILKGHLPEWYEGITPQAVRDEWGIPASALLTVHLANHRKIKGTIYLLRALALLPKHSSLSLLLIGRGMERFSALIRSIHQSHPGIRIHICGYRADALPLVAAADLMVLTSLYGESITKSVIEAMSLGVPAIITDIPGNRELLEHNVSGLKVPAGNSAALAHALQWTMDNRATLPVMGRAARQHAATRLHHQATVDGYRKLIEEI